MNYFLLFVLTIKVSLDLKKVVLSTSINYIYLGLTKNQTKNTTWQSGVS